MFNSRRPVWVSVPHRREIVHEHFEHFLYIFLAFHTLRAPLWLCDCDFNTFLFYLYLFTPSPVLLCVVSRSHVYAADDCSWAKRCGKKKKCIRKWHKTSQRKRIERKKRVDKKKIRKFFVCTHCCTIVMFVAFVVHMRPERSPKWQAESR